MYKRQVQQLAEGTISKVIPEITLEKEIYFVPGIKNFSSEVTFENCEAKDIMRGEETETVGVMQRCRCLLYTSRCGLCGGVFGF